MENKMFLMLLCLLMLFIPSRSQTVHNATIHDYTLDNDMIDTCNNVNYSHYCFQPGNCHTGTHVMCMYYKTGMVMGPLCESGKMFKMHQGIRNIIINSIKVLRDEVSAGTARGKNDDLLPRAYNLTRRLTWNNELATFAQVWANQCQRAHDFCRATERFKDADQFVGVDIFTHKEWRNIRTKDKLKEMEKQCLTRSKVKEAIEYMFKLMKDEDKERTTADMIVNYQGVRNKYLMLLNHNTTHIGCGMSYYLEYKWLQDMQKHDVFVLQMVCNLSHRPVIGTAIYNTTRPPDFDDSDESPFDTPGIRNLVPGSRGPGVVIMPIITVEDAPLSLTKQGTKIENPKKIDSSSRKSSIFSRVPIFNLPSHNHNNTSKAILDDKVSLKKKLKTLLEQVPKRDVPALRELLKQIVKKHKTENNQSSRTGPVEKLETEVSEAKELILQKNANPDADEELLRLANGNLNENAYGHGILIGADVANYPGNADIVNIKDEDINSQTQFHIPNIRKQKPIVHSKQNSYDNNKASVGYSPAKNEENNNLIKSDIVIIDHTEDTTNTGNIVDTKPVIYAEENQNNNHKSTATDDTRLKRRMYLENEVTKLKRKLQHLRQYIRENDVNDNARIRPVVTQNGQRTTKIDERRSFYMPDRAHPLHEY